MGYYDHLECSVDVTVRIAERSCTRYAPTIEIGVMYDGIEAKKRGIFTYGDIVDISVPCLCSYPSEEVIVWNHIEDGFAVDLVTINANGRQYIYDASTYSTFELDIHLKNDACWYYDSNPPHASFLRWATPLEFQIDT